MPIQVLQTKFLNDQGVAAVTDFLPRQPSSASTKPLLHWLIRRVEVRTTDNFSATNLTLFRSFVELFRYASKSHLHSITLVQNMRRSPYSTIPSLPRIPPTRLIKRRSCSSRTTSLWISVLLLNPPSRTYPYLTSASKSWISPGLLLMVADDI